MIRPINLEHGKQLPAEYNPRQCDSLRDAQTNWSHSFAANITVGLASGKEFAQPSCYN